MYVLDRVGRCNFALNRVGWCLDDKGAPISGGQEEKITRIGWVVLMMACISWAINYYIPNWLCVMSSALNWVGGFTMEVRRSAHRI